MKASSVDATADLASARPNVAPPASPASPPAHKPNLAAIIEELFVCSAVIGAALVIGTIIAFFIAAFLGWAGNLC